MGPESPAARSAYRAFSFVLEIDGAAAAGFAEADGLNDARPQGSQHLTLKRGLAAGLVLWRWPAKAAQGSSRAPVVCLILRDERGDTASRWRIAGARIEEVVPPPVPTSVEVTIERLVLACDGITVVGPP
jgi:hypothetical protein